MVHRWLVVAIVLNLVFLADLVANLIAVPFREIYQTKKVILLEVLL